jgi:Fic family protein
VFVIEHRGQAKEGQGGETEAEVAQSNIEISTDQEGPLPQERENHLAARRAGWGLARARPSLIEATDQFGDSVESIGGFDRFLECVENYGFFRHIRLTCRMHRHIVAAMARTGKSPERRSDWRPGAPFNDLPVLPPEADLETKAVLKGCIGARAALAELKQAAELIPNQAVLINTLPLLEAQASSEIENVITTTDRLFQFREVDDNADTATKEALRYSQALLQGFESLRERPLATRTAGEICSRIKDKPMRVRNVPGTALARTSGGILYTPPVGEDLLRSLLANLDRYLHEARETDPLIRMAVAHYQFEAIHPFTDGNGRTGRVLNSLFLISEGLLTLPILYLSRYIIKHKGDYYRLLREVTRSDAWEAWVVFMLRGVEQTASWTLGKITAIRQLQTETVKRIREAAPKTYSYELVNLIFELPYCRIQNVIARKIAGRQTASVYLKELARIGVLEEKAVGREKLFIHPKLMRLLTRDANDFAPYS